MKDRIENIDYKIRFVGKRCKVTTSRGFEDVPELWKQAQSDGFLQKLIGMAWENPKCKLESLVGICGNDSVILSETFDYFIGVRYDTEIPHGMEELTISPCVYAVFPNQLEAWKRLYSEWLPSSGYELARSPCIEHFLAPGNQVKDELWVPVIEKRT